MIKFHFGIIALVLFVLACELQKQPSEETLGGMAESNIHIDKNPDDGWCVVEKLSDCQEPSLAPCQKELCIKLAKKEDARKFREDLDAKVIARCALQGGMPVLEMRNAINNLPICLKRDIIQPINLQEHND